MTVAPQTDTTGNYLIRGKDMTPRVKRQTRRAMLDLVLIATLIAGVVGLVVWQTQAIDGHGLAEEYSSFNFYPPEEQ